MRLDDPAQAEDSFRRAIALNPREPNVLHNYGWLLCQQNRYADAQQQFTAALAVPSYTDRAKTLMTQGLCQLKAGQNAEAERSLMQAYELDAGNPVIGYNLASLLRSATTGRARSSTSAASTTARGQRRDAVARHQDRTPARTTARRWRSWRTNCSGASPSRGRRSRTSAGISMIERASEFGASAAVPLVGGDSTHMTAGDMLREAREAHGLHIDMVAAALKVPPQKLAALEADDIDSLPDPVFARALAASVCRALADRSAAGAGQAARRPAPGLADADRTISSSLRSAAPRSNAGVRSGLPSRAAA